jgi:hypothetical protein
VVVPETQSTSSLFGNVMKRYDRLSLGDLTGSIDDVLRIRCCVVFKLINLRRILLISSKTLTATTWHGKMIENKPVINLMIEGSTY